MNRNHTELLLKVEYIKGIFDNIVDITFLNSFLFKN